MRLAAVFMTLRAFLGGPSVAAEHSNALLDSFARTGRPMAPQCAGSTRNSPRCSAAAENEGEGRGWRANGPAASWARPTK
jgi:hypothetical protein